LKYISCDEHDVKISFFSGSHISYLMLHAKVTSVRFFIAKKLTLFDYVEI